MELVPVAVDTETCARFSSKRTLYASVYTLFWLINYAETLKQAGQREKGRRFGKTKTFVTEWRVGGKNQSRYFSLPTAEPGNGVNRVSIRPLLTMAKPYFFRGKFFKFTFYCTYVCMYSELGRISSTVSFHRVVFCIFRRIPRLVSYIAEK